MTTFADFWNYSRPYFQQFIETPNTTPMLQKVSEGKDDRDHTLNAVRIVIDYLLSLDLQNISIELTIPSGTDFDIISNAVTIHYDESDLSPMLIVNVNSTIDNENKNRIGFYAHIDKQPPMTDKWTIGAPYKFTEIDDKVYGRGTVDDGYALFTVPYIIKTLQESKSDKDDYVFIFECSEESGSCDLSQHLATSKDDIGTLDYLFCVDSGGIDNSTMWLTSGLRGCCIGDLTVKISDKAFHSGDAGGIVPSPFNIATSLLSELTNMESGYPNLKAGIPDYVIENMDSINITTSDPTNGVIEKIGESKLESFFLNCIYPNTTVVGISGLPSPDQAGNVINPDITLRLSTRIPPTGKGKKWQELICNKLTKSEKKTFGAQVDYTPVVECNGWISKPLNPILEKKMKEITKSYYGNEFKYTFCGGSIPLMDMLMTIMPSCKIIGTGIVTSTSGMHGPNEHLDKQALDNFMSSMIEIIAFI
jgi:acetylornithine deacetylase/succinyl-diaminopimelate desuccinylase-like protein